MHGKELINLGNIIKMDFNPLSPGRSDFNPYRK